MEMDSDITIALHRMQQGDSMAVGQLLPLIYGRLKGLASQCMGDERGDHTLQATALVHEAYMKLNRSDGITWEDRGHFFAAAATSMRRVLVDHARARRAEKRGGGRRREDLESLEPAQSEGPNDLELLALHEALERLETQDARKAQVVELRYFAGLSSEETAEVLGVTARTVDRDWLYAQAWLATQLSGTAFSE